jgi:anti-sigma B factor antagonist
MSLDPPPTEFIVEVLDAEDDDPIAVVLAGEVDVAAARELREALVQITEGRDVLVDLEDVTFLDSTGISVLVMACNRIRSQGGGFSLVGMSDPVRRVLEITSLLDFFRAPGP